MSLDCRVYRGKRKPDAYVYVDGREDLARVPQQLLQQLGGVELALQFELSETRRLVHASATEVMHALAEQGFYLQLPPGDAERLVPGAQS